MDMELWEKTAKLHGDECVGLAYGFRMAQEVKRIFGDSAKLHCIVPKLGCLTEALNIILGLSVMNRNLQVKSDSPAYIFYEEGDDEGWQFIAHTLEMPKEADPVTGILAYNREKLFDIVPCDL
jgi:formylmethanofuran dehydrogenase subunit E